MDLKTCAPGTVGMLDSRPEGDRRVFFDGTDWVTEKGHRLNRYLRPRVLLVLDPEMQARADEAPARVAALEAGINAVVESVDALNDGGWTDLIAGAFDKFSRDLRALTEKDD